MAKPINRPEPERSKPEIFSAFNEIAIYSLRLDSDEPGNNTSLYRHLSSAEVARAQRFINLQHSQRWARCRSWLRSTLAAHLKVPPATLEFGQRGNGKPVIEGMSFNLSHSDNMAILAVTSTLDIGADIEFVRPINNWRNVVQRFFAKEEIDALLSLKQDQQLLSFYRCWTRKEAMIKATGEGLSAKLDSFAVTLAPNSAAQVLRDDQNRSWQLFELATIDNYVASLAVLDAADLELTVNVV